MKVETLESVSGCSRRQRKSAVRSQSDSYKQLKRALAPRVAPFPHAPPRIDDERRERTNAAQGGAVRTERAGTASNKASGAVLVGRSASVQFSSGAQVASRGTRSRTRLQQDCRSPHARVARKKQRRERARLGDLLLQAS
jgi:hypothetical protein